MLWYRSGVLHFALLVVAVLLPFSGSAGAQDTLQAVPEGRTAPLVTLGSSAEDRLRTAQLLGGAPSAGFLLRGASTLSPPLPGEGLRWSVIAPEAVVVWNSALPHSQNDGALWAGKGVSASVLAGVRAEAGPLFVVLAPQLLYAQNGDFADLLPDSAWGDGSPLPWYTGRSSADLPLRFGEGETVSVDPGQSTVGVRAGSFAFGASTENQWWGPGVRNGIVMSGNAAGVPHLFVRTGPPLETRLGAFEAKLIVGALSESSHFDTIAANDHRSLSAFVATFRPAGERGLTLGLARAVQAPVSGPGAIPGRAADALAGWTRPDSARPGPEQLFSVFGRWIFPRDGLEVYAEWARQELPGSVGEFLAYPNHSQGYTLGLQWAGSAREAHLLRFQGELTYLEQSTTFRIREVPRYYTSASIPQGYTHRGQVIGAAIGPGASSHWLAADYLAPTWRLGLFGGRIRWDNDAFYTTPRATTRGWPWLAHDVSIFGGVRGGFDLPALRMDAELTTGTRLNFLYQNRGDHWERADDAVDVRNYTLRLVLTPLGGQPRR